MKKRIYIIFFLSILLNCVFASFCGAQNRTDSLQNIKELIIKHGTVSAPGVGLFFSPSKYWFAFGFMTYIATDEELNDMLNENNSALKVYSYLGLLQKNYSNIKSIKKRIFKDSESVNTFFGCISGREMNIPNCIKYYLKHAHYSSYMISLLNALKKNENYRNKLFDDLISDREIKWPPLIE